MCAALPAVAAAVGSQVLWLASLSPSSHASAPSPAVSSTRGTSGTAPQLSPVAPARGQPHASTFEGMHHVRSGGQTR